MTDLRAAVTARGSTSEETMEIGRRIGRVLRPGAVLVLSGEIGAGKTTMTQGIALGMGIDDYVTSPTFTLVNEYWRGSSGQRLALYHVDLYRLSGADEAFDLGMDEYLFGDGVTVIEWAERAPDVLPDDYLLVRISIEPDDARSVVILAVGEGESSLLRDVERSLGDYASGH